jgi:hypothetical protein
MAAIVQAGCNGLTQSAQLALYALRCGQGVSRLCRLRSAQSTYRDGEEFQAAAARLRDLCGSMPAVRIGRPGAREVTRDEQALLGALEIAQADQLAPHDLAIAPASMRDALGSAIEALAATLALQGHWLSLAA